MPVQLKADLQKEADEQGRKLTQEVLIRLRESFKTEGKAFGAQPAISPAYAQEKSASGFLSESDQAMLDIFRAMPATKQLALLSLFKN
jgi:hypothetical protein